jgi:stage II sporulation protein D
LTLPNIEIAMRVNPSARPVRPPTRRRLVRAGAAAALVASAALTGAGGASARGGFYIRGGGDGHGIGLSQYGTLGYAQHGFGYGAILGRYYHGTTLGTTNPNQLVTVLVSTGSAAFSGASTAAGRRLKPRVTYRVRTAANGTLQLMAGRRSAGSFRPPLVVSGPGPLSLAGQGSYRGSLVFQPQGSAIQTIDSLDLEDYVRGVISAEMPSSWSAQALDAQAIAARTYAITDGRVSSAFQLYSDTRSQMYRGVAAETPATDAAVARTRGQVVTYHGVPVVTYFFASSGGYTESIQDAWTGVTPEAWLIGVPDPYDNAGGNPYYRWKVNLTLRSASAKLHGLLKGSLVGIQARHDGPSPRVVTATVIGTRGRTNVTGTQLQQAFGLLSTYMAFTTIKTNGGSLNPRPASGPFGSSSSTSGGVSLAADVVYRAPVRAARAAALRDAMSLHGSLYPVTRRRILVQRLRGRRFVTVARIRTDAHGAYWVHVPGPGRYRIIDHGVGGPVVSVTASH